MTDSLSQARLDALWDFSDAPASEQRFRDELAIAVPGSVIAAELATQLARSLGLQERYAEAETVLDGIDRSDAVVLARVLLERGRLRNSSGHPDEAIPLFEETLAAASSLGNDFLAVDAAHMLAIAQPGRAAHWTARALETVDESDDPRTKRWAVSLHNNSGWALFDSGDYAGALTEFERAADAARDFGSEQQRIWAHDALDRTLQAIEGGPRSRYYAAS
jgi:tetratricopeptide (TPR) repeat protein